MNVSPPTAAAPERRLDVDALLRIRSLEFRAKAVVEGFLAGLHRSPYHGFSVEFTEYRPYVCGDDLRYLDWKLLARSDRYYVKRFEDETNLRCYLVLDTSRSMQFGSLGYTKADYAATLAATLGYFLYQQRDAVGLLTFDESVREFLPPRYRPGYFRRMLGLLERPSRGQDTNLLSPLRTLVETLQKRGIVVLISDFLSETADLEGNLAALRGMGHEVLLFPIADPQELDFSFDEPTVFRDMESGQDIFVQPGRQREEYLSRMREHFSRLHEICTRTGVDFHRMATNQPLDAFLFELLRSRRQAGATTQRRRR